jgi:uncharacterized protein with PQ loop repeat
MSYDYLMYGATILYLVCYVPELYANYINKNANAYNVPEKVIMLSATSLALSYSIATKNNALMINYAPNVALDIIALLMRLYYAYMTKYHQQISDADSETDDAEVGPQDLEANCDHNDAI